MKRIISCILVAALLLTVLPTAFAAGSPADYGWSTDETAGQQNFAGWTAEAADSLRGDYDASTGNHRVWKSLIVNQATFTATLTVTGSKTASAYVKLLGVTVELDGRGGTGQQEYVKINGSGKDWLACKDASVTVSLARENGGDITVTLTGAENDTPVTFTANASESNENLELGVYAGTVAFAGISVACGTGTVTAPTFPVSLTEGLFLFNTAGSWAEKSGGWTTGSSSEEGLWVQSDASDGASSQAAYIAEKLSGEWTANVCITPISTENNGRAVTKVQILDQYKNPKIIFTLEQMVATQKIRCHLQSIDPNTNNWADLFSVDTWTKLPDTAYHIRLSLLDGDLLSLEMLGNAGYTAAETAKLPAGTAELLSYAGVFTEKTTARFSNITVGAQTDPIDYVAEARIAAANIEKNFVADGKLIPIDFGYPDGTVTNSGYTVHVGAGAVWEGAVMLMAIDTLAQNPAATAEEKNALAQCIANTVNFYVTAYSEAQCVTPGCAPINHAMDDCGWNAYCFLLGYRYNTKLGNTAMAVRCLDYAKKLFNNSYDHYYDDALGGGMWYNNKKETKSLYACTLALVGYDLYDITKDGQFKTRYTNIYNAIENNLARDDGLYWIEISADGIGNAATPYDISEGGSCTYLGGNMCMAVLNTRLGNYDKALRTALGMTRYETDKTGAWLNDRDAWNNTFFAGLFVREVVNEGYADASTVRTLQATVRQILKNCVFEDGYYSASWQGPKEPYSWGYPSGRSGYAYYDGQRNRWGSQNNEGGAYIGSTPNQMMTTATTAHVLFAAAVLDAPENAADLKTLTVDNSIVWPVANPAITSYALETYTYGTAVVRLTYSDGATAYVNGEYVSGGTVLINAPVAEIKIISADKSVTNTYTLRIREDACTHPETEVRNASPAGCTAAGYTGDTYCTKCGELLEQGSATEALGHDYVGTDVVSASCTSGGIRSLTCSRCGDKTSEIVPATGHNYAYGVCTLCGERQSVFADIPANAWYFGSVYEAYRLGLMSGTSATAFEPLGRASRAMVVSVLYRLEGSPDVSAASNPFADVKAGKWYTNGILWANSRNIVAGYSNGNFGTDDPITREQLVAILYRYAEYKGLDVSARADITGYPDYSKISSYARQNVAWAVAAGIISGKSVNGQTCLDPRGNATRAELASIFVRFFSDYINN